MVEEGGDEEMKLPKVKKPPEEVLTRIHALRGKKGQLL